MSEAIQFVSGLTFKEIMNVACYGVLNPAKLTARQSITRLYRYMLRSQMDTYWANYALKTEINKFYDNLKKIRADFEKMRASVDPDEIRYLKEKYEYMIYENFDEEPYVHFSRGHTLDLRKISFPAEMLEVDDIGYYKPKLLGGMPSESVFYEDYPLTSEAWLHAEPLGDPHYEFEEPPKDFKSNLGNGEDDKKILDQKMEQEARKAKEINDKI